MENTEKIWDQNVIQWVFVGPIGYKIYAKNFDFENLIERSLALMLWKLNATEQN